MLGDQRLIGRCVWEDGGRGDQSEGGTGVMSYPGQADDWLSVCV